jgi:peptide/nickel transport system substrate-binding protein
MAIRKNVKNLVFRNDGYIDVTNMYVLDEEK